MVCPAQLRVRLEPISSPSPEQGPMSAVKVVLVVIAASHAGLAKTGGKVKISVEPRTVRRSRTPTGLDTELFFKGKHPLTKYTTYDYALAYI